MIVYWPIILMLVGLLLYAFAHNAKLSEVGRLVFFCGCFMFAVWVSGKGAVKIFH